MRRTMIGASKRGKRTMASKPVTRFLLQERKDKKPFLYAWTPSLAQRPDMRPISAEEARVFIKEARLEEERQRRARIAAELEAEEARKADDRPLEEEYPDREIKPVIDELEAIAGGEDQVESNLSTQDELLSIELKKINSFKKSNTLEEYMLRKYRINMLQKELPEMKVDAGVALKGLAQEQKLYRIVE